MITGFFLTIIFAVLSFLVGLLPTIAFPAALSSALSTAWYLINSVSFLLPVSTILTVLGLALSFHVAVLAWRLVHLIGGYLRGR